MTVETISEVRMAIRALQNLSNRVLKGRELQQILGSENSKEGDKTKILFKPLLFRENGGFFKAENHKIGRASCRERVYGLV